MHPLAILAFMLLPWAATWIGIYYLKSIVLSFALYHGLCLLPVVVFKRKSWLDSLKRPSNKELLLIGTSAVLLPAFAFWLYRYMGMLLIDEPVVLARLAERGFTVAALIPLTLYFVLVNATLEELFWRGVIMPETERFNKPRLRLGTLWTAVAFAGWHYVVFKLLLKPGFAELMIFNLMLLGMFFEWTYRRSGTIVSSIMWHMVFDLAVIFVLVALL